MSKYVDGIEFITEECANCGMPFAMTLDFQQRRRNDHKSFYCPRGHVQHYTGKTEEQKLREELNRKQRQLEAESGRAAIFKHQRDTVSKRYGKMRERVKNGVCPCCNRTFQNLLEHMKTKHPEFGSHEVLKSIRDMYGLTQSALAEEIGIQPSYISLYERNKPLPSHAKESITDWIDANA